MRRRSFIDHASCDNTIEANDLRFGGDGIFIRANEGPLTPDAIVPPKNASNRNVLKFNDCSSSPNNAIEADFVDDTVMEGNNCSDSHYGMWLGYSRRSNRDREMFSSTITQKRPSKSKMDRTRHITR